jgi:dipeptidyl aminopeptidase/acylaminoacyl peptidase
MCQHTTQIYALIFPNIFFERSNLGIWIEYQLVNPPPPQKKKKLKEIFFAHQAK